MDIRILYDNQATNGFRSGWGFSALVGEETLFDTGEEAEPLLYNMQKCKIETSQIKRLILSHEDWDHVGGIAILKQCGPVKIYMPVSFSDKIRKEIAGYNSQAEIVEVKDQVEAADGMTVTRELGTLKKEISLALRTDRGTAIVAGCAHPGLDNIIQNGAVYGPVTAVIGGFHGFSKLEALANIPLIVPTHCTRRKEEILQLYPRTARSASAGDIITLPDTRPK